MFEPVDISHRLVILKWSDHFEGDRHDLPPRAVVAALGGCSRRDVVVAAADRPDGGAGGEGPRLGADAGGRVPPGSAGGEGAAAVARGGPAHAAAPRYVRPHRLTADRAG